jgi:hypothetical protein
VHERHVEARANRGDLHVRRDHCLAAADRGPHRLAEHRVHASAAVLHFAVDPDDCTLAVGDGRSRTVEQLDELGMRRSPSSAPAPNSGRRSSTKRPAKEFRITAIPSARATGHDAVTPSSERTVSRILMVLRISTITSSCGQRGLLLHALRPSHSRLVDLVQLADLASNPRVGNVREIPMRDIFFWRRPGRWSTTCTRSTGRARSTYLGRKPREPVKDTNPYFYLWTSSIMMPSGPRTKASRKPGLRVSGPTAISAPFARSSSTAASTSSTVNPICSSP